MKKQLILFIAFCLTLQVINGQMVNLSFTLTNASTDSTCDGELNLSYTGFIDPVIVNWYDENIQVIGTSNYLSSLCNGNYSTTITNSNCLNYFFNTNIQDSSTFGNTLQLNLLLSYDSVSNYNTIEILNFIGNNVSYNVSLGIHEDSLTTLYFDNLALNSNLIIDSLISYQNPNIFYNLYISDSTNSNFISFSFNTSLETSSCDNYSNNLYASAQGSPVSDSSACDGHAFTEVYGGTPPYTYQYSSGSTSDTANGLCPGSYIVTVTDANGDVFNTSFVIGYPNTYYYSGGSSNYLDTLYSNALQDCGIDYTLPIDSFYIDSSHALSNWEYVVNWTIVQDTNEFLFTETYFVDSTGYYYFGLSLYCDEAQRVSSNFASYSFFAGTYADMSSFPTQIQTISNNNSFEVYPNPSNGIFNLTSNKKITSYSIFDTLGRKMLDKTASKNMQSIDIQSLNTGIYYLTLQFEDGSIGNQKLVKK
ncbi:MAG: T9SS type A sorting domain-containing protein [Bacteroidia bacterium]